MKSDLKVAIVHDYLSAYGGAEGVVQAIWELFPQADIYTAECDEELLKKLNLFSGAKIYYPKWKNSIPHKFARLAHKVLVANLPFYFAGLNLKDYDLIISSTAHFAKGLRTHKNQIHISYIHTPPRFLYGLPGEFRKRSQLGWKILLWPIDNFLKIIDRQTAQWPDYLLCNSYNVKERIRNFYGREASVINPFPNVNFSQTDLSQTTDQGFYLIVSRLAAYKNIDLAIKTCGKNDIPLKIAGTGPEEQMLKDIAAKYDCIEMLGLVTEQQKIKLYETCRAVICAVKDEDFGMAPLEPMLFGKPVVALKDGGYLETVNEPVAGIFFNDLTEASLLNAIKELENTNFDPQEIKNHARQFSKENFQNQFREFVEKVA